MTKGGRHVQIALATDVLFYAPIALALATAKPRSAWSFVNPVYPERRLSKNVSGTDIDPLLAELTGVPETVLAVGDPERVEWHHGAGGVVAISTLIQRPFYFLFDPEQSQIDTAESYIHSLASSNLEWLNIFAPAGKRKTKAATRTGTVLAHKLALDLNSRFKKDGKQVEARVFEAPPNCEEQVAAMVRGWGRPFGGVVRKPRQRYVFLSTSSRLWATYRPQHHYPSCVHCLTDLFAALGTSEFSSGYCMTALLSCRTAAPSLETGGFLGELLGSIEDSVKLLREEPGKAAHEFRRVAPDVADGFGFRSDDLLTQFFQSANDADAFSVQHFDTEAGNTFGVELWKAVNEGPKASTLRPFDLVAYDYQRTQWPVRRSALDADYFNQARLARALHDGRRLFRDAVPSVFESRGGSRLPAVAVSVGAAVSMIVWWVKDDYPSPWMLWVCSAFACIGLLGVAATCKVALRTVADVSEGHGGIKNVLRGWDALILIGNALLIPLLLLFAMTCAVNAYMHSATVRYDFLRDKELAIFVREPFAAIVTVSLAFIAGLWIRWDELVAPDRGQSWFSMVAYSAKALWKMLWATSHVHPVCVGQPAAVPMPASPVLSRRKRRRHARGR